MKLKLQWKNKHEHRNEWANSCMSYHASSWILLSHKLRANSKTHNLLLWNRLIWRCVHMIKFVDFSRIKGGVTTEKLSNLLLDQRSILQQVVSLCDKNKNDPYKFCFRKNSHSNSYNKSPWNEDWFTTFNARLASATSLRTIIFLFSAMMTTLSNDLLEKVWPSI